jgi:hypothetical protein
LPFSPLGKTLLPRSLKRGRELLEKGYGFRAQHGFVDFGNWRGDLNLNHWACHFELYLPIDGKCRKDETTMLPETSPDEKTGEKSKCHPNFKLSPAIQFEDAF